VRAIIKLCSIAILILCNNAIADSRYCGEPKRDGNGRIIRSQAVINEFKKLYPLPPQLDYKKYQINHSVPLVCGGCDIVENMTWMHIDAKTCAEDYCQDRHEQLTMCQRSYHK